MGRREARERTPPVTLAATTTSAATIAKFLFIGERIEFCSVKYSTAAAAFEATAACATCAIH